MAISITFFQLPPIYNTTNLVCLSNLLSCCVELFLSSLSLIMEVLEMEMDYFSTSTTTITTTNTTASTTPLSMDEEWSEWGTVIDWDNCLEAPPTDFEELGELIDSFMNHHEDSPNPDLAMIGENMVTTPPMVEEEVEDDGKGVRLVHLLLAGAEALTGGHRSLDLAGVILVRLKELTSLAAGRQWRDSNMERLAAHFTDALLALLDGADAKPAEAPLDSLEKIVAFQLLQDMSPYVKFGHFTANQAILEAVAGERRVHILDYDIMEGVQWASLMQALQTARPHLRITAVTRPGGAGTAGPRKSATVVQKTGRRLAAFAATIDLPFSFHHCRLDPGESFRPSSVKLVKGESVVANCVLHFSHRPSSSVASFLSGAAALGAKVVVVVEEEAGAGARGGGFAGRFMDSLHQHSALCDSLVAGFPNQDRARRLVERAWLGPKIVGSVGMSYKGGEEGEVSWGDWLEGSGFGPVGLSYFNHRQAKLLVALFNDGYSVEEAGAHKLVLGWKSRRLLTASAWSPPPAGSETGFTS